jgi:hypothetical protein
MKYYVYTSAKSVEELIHNINKLVPAGFVPFGSVYNDGEYVYHILEGDIEEDDDTAEAAYMKFWNNYGDWAIEPITEEQEPDDENVGNDVQSHFEPPTPGTGGLKETLSAEFEKYLSTNTIDLQRLLSQTEISLDKVTNEDERKLLKKRLSMLKGIIKTRLGPAPNG